MLLAQSAVLLAIGLGLIAIALFAPGRREREAVAVRSEPPLEVHAPAEPAYGVRDTVELPPEPLPGPLIGAPPLTEPETQREPEPIVAHVEPEPEPVVAHVEAVPAAPLEAYTPAATPEERFVAIEALASRAAFDDVAHALDDDELPIALQAAYLLREHGHREIVDGYLARAEPGRASELSGLLELIAP